MPMGRVAGGGGVVALVAVVIGLLLGVDVTGGGGVGGLGQLQDLQNQTAGAPAGDNTAIADECRTGADADRSEDCRMVGVRQQHPGLLERRVPAGLLPAGEDPLLHRRRQTACGSATSASRPVLLPGRPLRLHRPALLRRAARPLRRQRRAVRRRPTCSRTSTATTCRTCTARSGRAPAATAAPQSQSVRTELQADCYAGVWAQQRRDRPGYIDRAHRRRHRRRRSTRRPPSATTASSSAATGRVSPESWTHGSSEQRQQWFTTGYQSGDPSDCDTFGADLSSVVRVGWPHGPAQEPCHGERRGGRSPLRTVQRHGLRGIDAEQDDVLREEAGHDLLAEQDAGDDREDLARQAAAEGVLARLARGQGHARQEQHDVVELRDADLPGPAHRLGARGLVEHLGHPMPFTYNKEQTFGRSPVRLYSDGPRRSRSASPARRRCTRSASRTPESSVRVAGRVQRSRRVGWCGVGS